VVECPTNKSGGGRFVCEGRGRRRRRKMRRKRSGLLRVAV